MIPAQAFTSYELCTQRRRYGSTYAVARYLAESHAPNDGRNRPTLRPSAINRIKSATLAMVGTFSPWSSRVYDHFRG